MLFSKMAPLAGLLLFFTLSGISGYKIRDGAPVGIYDGKPIKITKVPYMAVYRAQNETFHCGAAIVHEKFLVTAAHCYKTCEDDKYITVGTDSIHHGENYEIEQTYMHPKYVHDDINFKPDYDVAVIKLKTKLKFSKKVQPIKMAESSLGIKGGEMLTAIGFGMTETGGGSKKLLSVEVPYIDQSECKKDYENTEYSITERMLCAGAEGKGSCHFDSGSPIAYRGVFVGITSGGRACGSAKWPVIYSRVSALRSFIDGVIRDHN